MKGLVVGNAFVWLFVSACCGTREPACGVTDHEPLSLSASDPAWQTLKQAEIDLHDENQSLPAAQRLMDCRDHWQTVVEEHVCHDAALKVCEQRCKTDAERKQCSENQDHARLVQQCREQGLPIFTGIYSSCQGFRLCGEVLQPSTTACSG